MNGIKNRLGSRRGESIAEVLVALLISAVALTMLASMVVSGAEMTRKSKEKFAGYYDALNELESRSGTAADGSVGFEGSGGAVKLTDGDVLISVYDNGKTGEEKITLYKVKE